ncbi:hypothetical protein ABFA25_00570 [Mycobacterium lepromatosis]|uniref:hypothetical protein n=1 Tax=Mycobacterium lepromatosis TaxID=480418 RepID=UPI0005F8676A
MVEFVASLYCYRNTAIETGSNDVGYFDAALAAAETAASMQKSYALTNAAQQILLHDSPLVPLWDYNSVIRWSFAVSNVPFT